MLTDSNPFRLIWEIVPARLRTLAKIGGVVLLITYAMPRIYQPTYWEVDPYDSGIVYVERHWLSPSDRVEIEWRSRGEQGPGWYTRASDGRWFLFLEEYLGP